MGELELSSAPIGQCIPALDCDNKLLGIEAMQAIVVKFIPCTNTKPSRFKAYCAAGSLTKSKGHYHDTNDNADARLLAQALAVKLGWEGYGDLIEGGLPNGDRVFVFPEKS